MTSAEAWFNNSLRPRKPDGSLGWTAQDVHLDSHTAPELCIALVFAVIHLYKKKFFILCLSIAFLSIFFNLVSIN